MRFGRFDLQQQSRRLPDGGAPVAVGARALDVLSALAGAALGRILLGEAR
jgi:DNA-binding winged helix-turn-helix (wHTH) protein